MKANLIILIVMLTLFAVAGADAQSGPTTLCGARDQVVGHLQSRFGESVRSTGLAGPNRIVEVFASEETGSWTITVTSANGTTCLMASGQYFEAMTPVLQGEPL